MLKKIDELLDEVKQFHSDAKDEIEQFRIKYNGKKGILNDLFEQFKSVPNEQKKEFGQKPDVKESKESLINKIEALLADADRHWNYAHGCAKNMFGKERVQFCTEHQLWKIVAALVKDKQRRAKQDG